jgi:hypothetical protein
MLNKERQWVHQMKSEEREKMFLGMKKIHQSGDIYFGVSY